MKIAIISIGFFGDGILAGSFCENLKLNGCDRVDLFQKKWMWHANKHFDEIHTLLPPNISEENIIKILNSL